MDCINTQCFCRRLQRQVLWPTTNCGTKKCSAALDASSLPCVSYASAKMVEWTWILQNLVATAAAALLCPEMATNFTNISLISFLFLGRFLFWPAIADSSRLAVVVHPIYTTRPGIHSSHYRLLLHWLSSHHNSLGTSWNESRVGRPASTKHRK